MAEPRRKRRRRSEPAGPRRRALRFPVDAALVERAVEEGVSLSRTALTMATMNHIVVGALRSGDPYDPEQIARFVDAELRALVLEQASLAAHMRRLMAEFPPSFRRSTTISDHHLLVQRRVVYSALSTKLDRLRLDGEFVPAAVDSSRQWAWSELSHAIEVRLDAAGGLPASDPGYAAHREARMRAVRDVDLAELDARLPRALSSRGTETPGIRSRVGPPQGGTSTSEGAGT
ncbi:hypothetical protein [Subtercola boreus]|nr:hypothetical protein [Subtercola boreus]